MNRRFEHGRASLAAVVLLLLIAAVVAAVVLQRAPGARRTAAVPGPAAPEAPTPPPPDSAEIRRRWVDDIRGVELGDLGPARREIAIRFANARACTCGCGYTLAGCRAYDPSCEVSLPLAQALVDSVRAGWIRSASGIRARPASRDARGG